MRIVLDAMGSDDCPEPEMRAALQAVKQYPDEIILVGPEERLRPQLSAANGTASRIRIVHAPEAITMDDKGLKLALKAKRPSSRNSMAVGIDLVKNGQAEAFVTAGNTGGALATAFYRLGTIRGVERPALSGLFPVKNGYCVVLDIGGNPEGKELFAGEADVVVTDGFTGNVLLKSSEAVSRFLVEVLRQELMGSL